MRAPLTILITGCSSGFGHHTARELAALGHRVYATMREPTGKNAAARDSLVAAARDSEGTIEVLELDVTRSHTIEAAMEQVARHGRLDVLVHNAGVAAVGLVEEQSPALAQRLFDTNVVGAIRVQQAALPLLRQSPAPTIVGISSTLSRERAPFLATYTATKHAFAALLSTWAYELNPEGIRTVLVEPGTFPNTAMLENLLPSDQDSVPPPALRLRVEGLVTGLQAFATSGAAPSPGIVAQAVAEALSPQSQDCVVVDPSGFGGCARLNALGEQVQRELLRRYEQADLAVVVPK